MPLYQSPEEKQKAKQTARATLGDLFSSSGSHARRTKKPRMISRANPLLKTKVKMVEALTKAHQMEGDGLLLLLYFQLFKKTWNSRKEFQSCPGARCPDTVVYEHNFPQHWYTYDSKHGELLKRPGSFLDTAQILKYFSRPVDKDSGIVAQYLCSHENTETEELETSVEFFTQETLKDFLHNRKHRPDGVLQRFITPKGEHNFQIQAVWSPKVTLVYKRTNTYRMKDKTVGVYTRAVTCDGPPHFSREDLLAEKTREEVVKICQNFVQHFSSTEHKPVSRVVLYFKVDDKDCIWIMWASSLRIGTSKFSANHQRIPLNLSTKFTTPDAEQRKRRENVEGEELERKLLSKDVEQYRLSSDFMFATTFCREINEKSRPYTAKKRNLIEANNTHQPSPPREPLLLLDRRPRTAERPVSPPVRCQYFVTSDRPPFLPSPRINSVPPPWSPTNPFHKQVIRLGLEGFSAPAKLTNQHNIKRDQVKKIEESNMTLSQQEQNEWETGWWCATEKSEREYRELLRNEEQVRSWGKDQLYHMYSHTLNHGMQKPYYLQPPQEIWQLLCSNDNTRYAEEVMAALGLKEHDVDDDFSDSRVPTFYYCGYGCSAHINSAGANITQPPEGELQNRPIAQIAKDLDTAVTIIFSELKADLQQWTTTVKKQQKGNVNYGDSQQQLPSIVSMNFLYFESLERVANKI